MRENRSGFCRSIPCFGDGSLTRFGGYTPRIAGGYLDPNTLTFTGCVANRCLGWETAQEGFVPVLSTARQVGVLLAHRDDLRWVKDMTGMDALDDTDENNNLLK